jgi:putative spermidine/putrescine transport system ATP-binding protein
MATVVLEGIGKRFGAQRVLDRLSLEVRHGEFLTILGPSGSGKSTVLRLIAGLEVPDAGRIVMDGRTVAGEERWVPPQQRQVGMVFQNYALWPHMTALENVAFPFVVRGMARREATERAAEALSLVELGSCEAKRPGQMSGGEQQRVALARALAARPAILLMDECLSNLDARLREKMAGEMRRVQEAAGVTAIYVTHDPQEAFVLSDRIAVLEEGRIQQVDAPAVIYAHPRTPQVGQALGALNLLRASEAVELGLLAPGQGESDGIITTETRRAQRLNYEPGSGRLLRAETARGQAARSAGSAGQTDGAVAKGADRLLGVRPERVRLAWESPAAGAGQGAPAAAGRVKHIVQTGDTSHCSVQVGDRELRARLQPGPLLPSPGDRIWVSVDPEGWIVMEGD